MENIGEKLRQVSHSGTLSVREKTEDFEKLTLSKFASLSADSKGRDKPDTPCQYRTVFQRDRDRILHSNSFRRLIHKTQVFLSPEGDHYRTRLTHTLEVSQIARTIARSIRLNEDLVEAISYGHDLGHTPFGHAGERALDSLMKKYADNSHFHHYEQSVRVVDLLEKNGEGLNLTWEVRDGIGTHTSHLKPSTLEGKIVQIADRIAYVNHDLDDAFRAGVVTPDMIPAEIRRVLGETSKKRIDVLIASTIENSGGEINDVRMDDVIYHNFIKLRTFMFENVYTNPVAKGEEQKVDSIISHMFDYFIHNPKKLFSISDQYRKISESEGVARAICDYIAGMTDNYALTMYDKLFVPKSWAGY